MPSKRTASITPELQYFLMCQGVETDEEGNFSLRNVFDRVIASGYPSPVRFTVCVQFFHGLGAHKYWLRIKSPKGETVETPELEFWLANKSAAHRVQTRTTVNIGSDESTGRYELTAVVDGRDMTSITLTVDGPRGASAD